MTAQRIAGRYQVVRPLGDGPLGKVYQVVDHDAEPGRPATLKILRADVLDHARLEASLAELEPRLRALRHPGINPLENVGRTPLGLLYLASGFAAGEDLRALAARRGALPPARVAAIARGILEPLAAAHAAGLPHGDLHPGNVLLRHGAGWSAEDPFGTSVVLLDHGVLELVGAARPASLAPYVAPELEEDEPGRAAPTPRSDVYAVGALLLELLAGGPDTAPQDAPAEWRKPLAAALADDPAARPADAAALLALLPVDAPASGEAADARRELAVVTAGLHEAEQRSTAAERELETALSTGFARLAERDETLAQVRAERATAADRQREVEAALAEARTELEALRGRTDAVDVRAERDAALAEREPEMRRLRSSLSGARMLAGALAVAALAAGGMWWRARDAQVIAASAANDPALLARVEEAERETQLLRDAQIATDASTQAALDAQADAGERIAALTAEIDAWKRSDGELRAELEERGTERDSAREEAEAAQRELAAGADAIGEAQTRLAELEVELGRARDPELFALDQLDRVLSALEADDGRAARARYQALHVTNPELAGLAGLDRLTAAALRLEEAREADDLLAEIERRREAAAALADARGEGGAAALAEADWVRREGERRAESVRAALARLEERSAAERAELDRGLDARWHAILNEPPDVAPREVLAVAGWFDDGRLAEFLEWQARYLRDTLEVGGMLEVPSLLKLRHLDAWADVVAADPAFAESIAGREIALFRFARRWRNTPEDGTPPAPDVAFQAPDGAPATSGWRADLALRAHLCGPDAAWPGDVGGRFLYLVAALVDGQTATTWQLDEVVASDPGAWRIRRTFYRADGSILSESNVRIARVGKRLVEEERPGGALLDAASERAHPAAFVPELELAPPADLVSPEAFEAFRAELEAAPPAALAYENLGMTSWFSPRYGLLAIESELSFRRELAWADPR
jgi:hypothetical protein